MNVNQTFSEGDIQVTFRENESAAFYALKDGEPYFLCVDIVISQKGRKISQYCKEFNKPVTSIHYQSFVKKFIENETYRQTFLHEDESPWEGVIAFQNNNGVNKRCQQAIDRLNQKKKRQFKDFAALKTHGIDVFSRTKKEKLLDYLSQEDLNRIEAELDEEKNQLNAMRWVARGLHTDLAIRKVKTDLEIRQNMKAYKTHA